MNEEAGQVILREMLQSDIAAGLALCRQSRWNQLSSDWELFLALSPRGCRVAVLEDRVVGTVTTVRYEDRFSWIGMVLVDPAERRQGVGTRLLRKAIDILNDGATIRLDATPAGREVYLKLGFVEEYGLSRMETVVADGVGRSGGGDSRPMTEADLDRVAEMDRQVFGADRRKVLEWMLAGAPEYAQVVKSEGEIAGYAFGRHGHNFEHLGPVIARDRETARRLVAASLSGQSGRPFILDAARHDAEWTQWLESIGFKEQRPFIRMFLGENRHPGLPEKQFAILGPEFG